MLLSSSAATRDFVSDECDIRRVSLHYKPKRPIFYYDHSMPIELLKLEIEIWTEMNEWINK